MGRKTIMWVIIALVMLSLSYSYNIINSSVVFSNSSAYNGSAYFVNASNIVVDCNLTTIRGNGTGVAFMLNNKTNITIVGCYIQDFEIGIEAFGSLNITLLNNSFISDSLVANLTNSSIDLSYNFLSENFSARIIGNYSLANWLINAYDSSCYLTANSSNVVVLNKNYVCNNLRVQDYNLTLINSSLNLYNSTFSNIVVNNSNLTLNQSNNLIEGMGRLTLINSTSTLEGSFTLFGNVATIVAVLNNTPINLTDSLINITGFNNSFLLSNTTLNIHDLSKSSIKGRFSINVNAISNVTREFKVILYNKSIRYNETVQLFNNGSFYMNLSYNASLSYYDIMLNFSNSFEVYSIRISNRTIFNLRFSLDSFINRTFDIEKPAIMDYYSNITTFSPVFWFNFSEQIQDGSYNLMIFPVNSSQIPGKLSYDNSTNQLRFKPFLRLAENITYVVNLSSAKDLFNNTMNPLVFNFTTQFYDFDNDNNPDYNDTDDDNDGINDSVDRLIGNASYINAPLNLNLSISINGSSNLSKYFNSSLPIVISNGSDMLVRFNFNFASAVIDLRNITLNYENNSILVYGLEGIAKTYYLKNTTSNDGICIKNSEVLDIGNFSENCTASNELWLAIGDTSGGISSYYNSTLKSIVVNGLSHSAITLKDDNVVPSIIAKSSPASVIDDRYFTISVTTDELALCRFSNTDINYSSMSYPLSPTTYSLSHSIDTHVSSDGTYTYYIRCKDRFDNYMQSSYSFSVVVNTSSSAQSSESTSTSSSSSSTSSSLTSSSSDSTPTVSTPADSEPKVKKAVVNEEFIRSWKSLKEGQKVYLKVTNSKIPIKAISFKVDYDSTDNPLFIVKTYKSLPSSIKKLSNVYAYLSFDPDNIFGLSDNEVDFYVPKSWAKERRIDYKSIKLFRYKNNKWNELKTNFDNDDNNYYYYKAITPGYSYFAIAGTKILATGAGEKNSGTKGNMSLKIKENLNATEQLTNNSDGYRISFKSFIALAVSLALMITAFILILFYIRIRDID